MVPTDFPESEFPNELFSESLKTRNLFFRRNCFQNKKIKKCYYENTHWCIFYILLYFTSITKIQLLLNNILIY